nr:hypothetical protein 18 [Pelagibacteraceae bacterium]
METKKCTCCGETKPITDFYKRKSRRDGEGLVPTCKLCTIERSRKRYHSNPDEINDRRAAKTYNTTVEHIKQMREEAGGICQCCGKPGEGHYKRLVIDHCHSTGKIRGLICQKCNTVLGLVKDRIEVLQNLQNFIETYG